MSVQSLSAGLQIAIAQGIAQSTQVSFHSASYPIKEHPTTPLFDPAQIALEHFPGWWYTLCTERRLEILGLKIRAYVVHLKIALS